MTNLTDSSVAALDTMSDRELVAYWNIMQFPGLVIGPDNGHQGIVSGLLTARGIDHAAGRRTVCA